MNALIWRAKHTPTLPPLFCVHGLTRRALDFEQVGQTLSDTRDVIALDMPGRGDSEWLSDKKMYSYPQYASDCLHILKEWGIATVDWLGTSMGGLIGMMLAGMPQHPIRKLALNDVGPFLPLLALKRIGFYVGRVMHFPNMFEVERHCRAIYADFGIKDDKQWQRFSEISVRKDERGGFTHHYDPGIAEAFTDISTDIDLWPAYHAVTTPLLIMRGSRSDVLQAETARKMCEEKEHAQLITIDGCGHAPALLAPEQIAPLRHFFN